MPADLTPRDALDEIRALFDQPDLDTSITYGFANDRVRAILARVTPTETHDHDAPTAVPGAGEVERVARAMFIADPSHHGNTDDQWEGLRDRHPEVNPILDAYRDMARAAITALRDGEVGGE